MPRREREELVAVLAGVGGDRGQRALLEEVPLVVERRDVGEVDAGDGQRAAPVEGREGTRYERADGSEQDGRVERFGGRVGRVAGRGGAEAQRPLPRGARAGEHVDRGALGDGELCGQVRGGAEAVDAEPAAGRQGGAAQRPVADDAGAQQRGDLLVRVLRRDAVGGGGGGRGRFRRS